MKFGGYQDTVYQDAMKYIAFESPVKSKRQEGDQYHIEKIYRINVAMLRNDLVGYGVLDETSAVADVVATPTIAIVPKAQGEGGYDMAKGVLAEYLQDRDFEVIVVEGTEKVNEMVQKASALGGTTDPIYMLALQTGSDIYITVDVDTSSRNVSGSGVKKSAVSVVAYYTATGKQVAASTGYSPERSVADYGAITQEATNDAANKVLNQILKTWKKEAKDGKYFKVVVTSPAGPSGLRSTEKQLRQGAPECGGGRLF